MGTDWHAAWAAALDELDLSLEEAEGLLASDHEAREYRVPDPWRPPQGLGPMPLDLKPRADTILARQIAVGQALSRAMVANRRQAALLDRVVESRQGARRPAYIDCAM
jgi:hypothetical protein